MSASGGEAAPVWVLADPRVGTAAQALGVAERLAERHGVPFRVVPLAWGPLARLPLPVPSLAGLTPEARAAFAAPLPSLAISAGRRSAPVSRWLRARGVRTVHLMRPGPFGASDFDLLVVGRHDAPRPAPNLMTVVGACHRLSPARLAAARAEWDAALGALARPRVSVLVGGPVRAEGLDVGTAERLPARVLRRFPHATLLATTSRRTGRAATDALRRALAEAAPGRHVLYTWGDPGPNPYAGFLAWADAVVVTGDSVSMISEALATPAPVLIATREGGRHGRLADSLYGPGLATPLRDARRAGPRAPLDEAARVAEEIAARGLLSG